jgi:hypothetical protein
VSRLTARRVALYAGALALLNGVLAVRYVRDGLTTPRVCDFAQPYAAAGLAREGRLAEAYDDVRFQEALRELLGPDARIMLFLYPPSALLPFTPLSRLPYLPALMAWWALGIGGAWLVARRIAPGPGTASAALGFTGVSVNLSYGQNGLVSAALLGAGLLTATRRPFLGGVLLGLLSYKPQLFVLVPVALVAGRRWRVLAGTAAGAGGSALLATWAYGADAWWAWTARAAATRELMLRGPMDYHKVPTVFGALRLHDVSPELAILAQLVPAVLALALVIHAWRQKAPLRLSGSALVLGTLLATPYGYEYDLALLGLVIAWMVMEGRQRPLAGWESGFLVLAWTVPFLHPLVAQGTGFPLGPAVLLGLGASVWRRIPPPEAAA